MASTILDVRGVSKKFRRGELFDSLRDLVPNMGRRLFGRDTSNDDPREFWALEDVSFSVERGEAFGIIGANGAGKSTILKLLTRIIRPTHGTIRVNGRLSALIEVSAGFHPDLTGRENIFLNAAILGMSREEIRRRFDAIVDFSGLEEFIDTPVKRYSSGMYSRLGFSVAAHSEPDVLLVDEVLSVGDYLFQRKCIDRMEHVVSSGATVVFVSHNLREVTNLCGRSLLLEHGRVQMIGPTSDVVSLYLKRGQKNRVTDLERKIAITQVVTHDLEAARTEFESDSKMYVTVEAEAITRHDDMSVVIQVVDEHQYPLFDTCTQRLGAEPLSLGPGETLRTTFELDLTLARGTYHINAFLHRYLTDQAYDRWQCAATFFVATTPEVEGVVTLHPKLKSHDVGETDRWGIRGDKGSESPHLEEVAGSRPR